MAQIDVKRREVDRLDRDLLEAPLLLGRGDGRDKVCQRFLKISARPGEAAQEGMSHLAELGLAAVFRERQSLVEQLLRQAGAAAPHAEPTLFGQEAGAIRDIVRSQRQPLVEGLQRLVVGAGTDVNAAQLIEQRELLIRTRSQLECLAREAFGVLASTK